MSAVSVISYETIKNAVQNNAAEIEMMYKTMEANKNYLSPRIAKLTEEILKDRKYSDPFYALLSAAVKEEYKDNKRSIRSYNCPYPAGDYKAFRWHLGRAIIEFLKDEPNMSTCACAKALGISECSCRRMKKLYLMQEGDKENTAGTNLNLEGNIEETVLQIIDQFKSRLIKELQQYKEEIKTLKNTNASLRDELKKHRKLVETMQQLITNIRSELNVGDKKESA